MKIYHITVWGDKMRSAKIIILLAVALCVNARVIKRQKKIARALKPGGFQVLDIPGFKSQAYGSLGTCGCPDPLGCSGACGCSGTCGANGYLGCDYRGACGCQSIFLEELPCNYGDGYGILNAEISNNDRIPVIRLPQTLGSYDAGIPVPAINLPSCQCNIPNCQCQRTYQILDSPCNTPAYEYLDVPRIMKYPAETIIRTVVIEQPAARLPNCGCQSVDVCGCQRQKCGCQLTEVDVPCICQLPAVGSSCGCPLSTLGMPCGCQLPVPSLPCEYQLPSIDCGCQAPCGCQASCGYQALCGYQASCGCQAPCGCQASCGCQAPCGCQPVGGSCGCQLPVPNVPYACYLPSTDIPYAYQLPALDLPCSCQLSSSACQLPCAGGELPSCGFQYLRQVTLQPPFL